MRAREAVMAEFRPILAEHDLTEQQWRVLRALIEEPDGRGVGELSAATYLLAPSVSRIVAGLEAKNLVTRTAVAGDGRRSRLVITAAGKRLYEAVSPLSEAVYGAIEQHLGRGDLELLYELLDRLASREVSPGSSVAPRS